MCCISRISNQETKRREIFHFYFLKQNIGMKKILKQVAGIDVAQKELVVRLGRMDDDLAIEMYGSKTFPNTDKGFRALISWVSKLTDQDVAVRFVMEATGVYHESLAYFLDQGGYELSIVLPNKISNYSRTLEIKTVTDSTSAEAIARFGLERKLDRWKRPQAVFKKLRQLTRERNQLVGMRTVAKNQLHAEQAEAEPNKSSVERIKKQIGFFNKQLKEIKEEIAALINEDPQTKKTMNIICTAPGVGILTAATVLAETNGFELIRNKRQLTSYAGLDIIEKQSGTSIKGKSRISKKGNKYLRKSMHLPALTAIRYDQRFKAIFTRLVSKHGIKMKAVVAVQRKLLEIIYTMYKTNTTYDKNYLTKNQTDNQQHEAINEKIREQS
jgi:transposase